MRFRWLWSVTSRSLPGRIDEFIDRGLERVNLRRLVPTASDLFGHRTGHIQHQHDVEWLVRHDLARTRALRTGDVQRHRVRAVFIGGNGLLAGRRTTSDHPARRLFPRWKEEQARWRPPSHRWSAIVSWRHSHRPPWRSRSHRRRHRASPTAATIATNRLPFLPAAAPTAANHSAILFITLPVSYDHVRQNPALRL